MSLEEIPDTVFVSLGSRGFHPVHPKECAKCGNTNPQGLELLEREEVERIDHEEGYKMTVDYKIQCHYCGNIFHVRLRHLYQWIEGGEKRVTTFVNILDENKNDMGWLGNY